MPFSLEKYQISFDSPSKTYSPGSKVSGKLQFFTDTPLSVRFIKISWNGSMKTCLPDVSDHFSKVFLFGDKVVWQSKYGMNILPPGLHVFPFSFPLPTTCEPSFYGEFGAIDYFVKVHMNRPWPKFNLETSRQFIVTKPYDIREKAKDMMVGARFSSHRVAGTIFKDGQFSIRVKMPTRAFTPGETIFATVEIENNTCKPIKTLETQLIHQSHYHHRPSTPCGISECRSCPLPSKNHAEAEEVLQIVDFECEVLPFTRRSFDIQITLSKNLQMVFENSLISTGYLLCFTAKNRSFSGNKLQCNVRIVIGTILNTQKTLKTQKTANLSVPPPPYDPKWSVYRI